MESTQRMRLILLVAVAASLSMLASEFVADATAGSLPAAVEDVAARSDLIVLGRVTETAPEGVALGNSWQMLYTRHTLEVEAYYKGSGPKSITLFTPGGFETRMVNGESKRVWSRVPGAVSAKAGEEFLAFLQAVDGGYVFIEWDGAKYPVKTDRETEERIVDLRLRKKRNMRGSALDSFKRVVTDQKGANPEAELEKRLIAKGGLRERVAVSDLQERISAVIQNEKAPSQEGPEVPARDNP